MTSRTRPRLTALALAIVVAAGVCGCGGGKGLSRTQLIAKADPICKRANHALDSSKISPQNLAQVAPTVAIVEHQVSSELARLTPPSSMEPDWKVIVGGFHRAGTGLEKIGQAARAKQHQALIEAQAELVNGQHDRAVTAYRNGFKDCSEY